MSHYAATFGHRKNRKINRHSTKRLLARGLERLEDRRVLTGWAGSVGGAAAEWITTEGSTVDGAGNSYIAGDFTSQVADFDPGPGVMNLSNAGVRDGFVAKYSSNGALAWARNLGGSGSDGISAVAFNSEVTGDYVYVTGVFSNSVNFGGPAGILSSAGGTDIFVAKLNASTGATVFAKKIGASSSETMPTDIAVANNRVYIGGGFTGTLDFDPGAGTASVTSTGTAGPGKKTTPSQDGYVVTLDSNGSFIAARQLGGTGDDYVRNIEADGTAIFVSGIIEGTADLDPTPAVKNASGTYIAKFSAPPSLTVSPDFVNSVGSLTVGYLRSDTSSVYLLGNFAGTIDVDPSAAVLNLTSQGSSGTPDAVVAKYAKSNGALIWANRFGGSGTDVFTSAAFDALNNEVYIGGNFDSSSIDFNPTAPGGELNSLGATDAFVLKLDSGTGAYKQVWQIGGAGTADRARVSGFVGTTVYVAGLYEATVAFPTGETLTSSSGSTDIFVMALDVASGTSPETVNTASTSQGSLADAALLSILSELDDSTLSKPKKKQ